MKKIFVDISSNTVKVYKFEDGKLELVISKQFGFRQNFSKQRGLNFNDEEGLVRLLERVNANYFTYQIEVYARGIFRDLSQEQFSELHREAQKRAKADVVIVTEDEERNYLKLAEKSGLQRLALDDNLVSGIIAYQMEE